MEQAVSEQVIPAETSKVMMAFWFFWSVFYLNEVWENQLWALSFYRKMAYQGSKQLLGNTPVGIKAPIGTMLGITKLEQKWGKSFLGLSIRRLLVTYFNLQRKKKLYNINHKKALKCVVLWISQFQQ